MPIEFNENIHILDQDSFGAVAYDVIERAFKVHDKLGRFFEEDVYKQELANEYAWISSNH